MVYESEKYGYFDRIIFADPAMNHPKDLQVDKNFYICPKDDYYCPRIFNTPITRKKLNTKTHKKEQVIRSSRNVFPTSFEENEKIFALGEKLDLKKWSNDESAKNLDVLDKLLIFFLRPEFHNQVFLAHNSGRYG